MGGALAEEGAVGRSAFFGGSVPLETLLDNGRILSMIVGVHLDVRRRNINLITAFFNTMIMRLLLVVGAICISIRAVVQRTVTHETVLERFVSFLVPLEVPYHFLFFYEDARVAIQTVEVLPGRKSL